MRCPECSTQNEDSASACSNCGLLLLGVEAPRRRRADLLRLARRSTDALTTQCPFCHTQVDADAIRCPACREVVNREVRSKKAARRRAYLNYASWMSYLFGLLAFLVFPPVGVLAIAAGILLSVAYYAVPDETQLDTSIPRKERLRHALRSIFTFERVGLPIPHFPRLKLVLVGTPLLAAVTGYMVNFFVLQRPMNDVLRQSVALRGMRVSTHYLYWMVPSVLVYDLRNITANQSRLDVHVALVEYAERLRKRHYREIELMYRGQRKFSITGADFQKLGDEYQKRNYAFVLFEFPEKLSGAVERSGAARDSADALIRFHDQWYGRDVMHESVTSSAGQERAARPLRGGEADRASPGTDRP